MENAIPPRSHSAKRRQFFSAGFRCLAFGGIVSFAAIQEIKRRRLAGDPDCIRLETCSDCVEFGAGCQKDKARGYRADQGR